MKNILLGFLPIAIRIVGSILDKTLASADTQRKFLAFVEEASKDFKSSASLKESYDRQKQRMDEMELTEKVKEEETQNG